MLSVAIHFYQDRLDALRLNFISAREARQVSGEVATDPLLSAAQFQFSSLDMKLSDFVFAFKLTCALQTDSNGLTQLIGNLGYRRSRIQCNCILKDIDRS